MNSIDIGLDSLLSRVGRLRQQLEDLHVRNLETSTTKATNRHLGTATDSGSHVHVAIDESEQFRLLSQATYLRIAIEEVTWAKFPLPRECCARSTHSRCIVANCTMPWNGRASGVRYSAQAREVLSTASFAHRWIRRVDVSEELLASWELGCFQVELVHKPPGGKAEPLGAGRLALKRLLHAPFDFGGSIAIFAAGRVLIGHLKVLLKLGSRHGQLEQSLASLGFESSKPVQLSPYSDAQSSSDEDREQLVIGKHREDVDGLVCSLSSAPHENITVQETMIYPSALNGLLPQYGDMLLSTTNDLEQHPRTTSTTDTCADTAEHAMTSAGTAVNALPPPRKLKATQVKMSVAQRLFGMGVAHFENFALEIHAPRQVLSDLAQRRFFLRLADGKSIVKSADSCPETSSEHLLVEWPRFSCELLVPPDRKNCMVQVLSAKSSNTCLVGCADIRTMDLRSGGPDNWMQFELICLFSLVEAAFLRMEVRWKSLALPMQMLGSSSSENGGFGGTVDMPTTGTSVWSTGSESTPRYLPT